MLPKSSRISREDFSSLLKSSKFFHSERFVLRVGQTPAPRAKFGVSVSKRISKSAVTRNTVRRRVYSVLYKYLENTRPVYGLFVAKPGAEKVKGENLEVEIKKLLLSANLIVIKEQRS